MRTSKCTAIAAMIVGVLLAGCSHQPKRRLGDTCAQGDECESGRCDELVCKSQSPLLGDAPCSHPLECASESCVATSEGAVCAASGIREQGDRALGSTQRALGPATGSWVRATGSWVRATGFCSAQRAFGSAQRALGSAQRASGPRNGLLLRATAPMLVFSDA